MATAPVLESLFDRFRRTLRRPVRGS